MGTFLRRSTPTVCFFCQTTISPPPPQPLSFHCPHCSCWNHYDANGDILSDDPAMHDETLNHRSFARRGASSLPSPFFYTATSNLHTCSISAERSPPYYLQQRTVLLCLPIKPETRRQSPIELSTALRRCALSSCLYRKTLTISASCHRIPIMHPALQASRPTKRPSMRVTLPSARNAPPWSKTKFGRKTLWRVRTRSDRG